MTVIIPKKGKENNITGKHRIERKIITEKTNTKIIETI